LIKPSTSNTHQNAEILIKPSTSNTHQIAEILIKPSTSNTHQIAEISAYHFTVFGVSLNEKNSFYFEHEENTDFLK